MEQQVTAFVRATGFRGHDKSLLEQEIISRVEKGELDLAQIEILVSAFTTVNKPHLFDLYDRKAPAEVYEPTPMTWLSAQAENREFEGASWKWVHSPSCWCANMKRGNNRT